MKNKSNVTVIVLLLPAFIMLVSCVKQKSKWHGTIEEKNGIIVVTNPPEPMYGADVFVLEEELAIPSKGREEEFIFHSTMNLAGCG